MLTILLACAEPEKPDDTGDATTDTDTTDTDTTDTDTTDTDTTDTDEEDTDDSAAADDSGDTTTVDPLALEVAAMTAAAVEFRASLDAAALAEMDFALDDAERTDWSNLPPGVYPRRGVPWGELDSTQLALAHALFASGTSDQGYDKGFGIIAIEAENEAGGDRLADDGLYYVTMFGEPSADPAWGWQLDGHHFVMNFTVVGDRLAFVPCFYGVSPAEVGDLRPLGAEQDLGWALMDALSDEQKAAAVLQDEPYDDVLAGPGRDDPLEAWEGLAASELDATQREHLLLLLETWVLSGPDAHGEAWLAEVEAGLDEVYFGWAGPTDDPEEGIYYRIHGPNVLVELDNLEGPAHVHSVLRDPRRDYGADLLAEHWAMGHP